MNRHGHFQRRRHAFRENADSDARLLRRSEEVKPQPSVRQRQADQACARGGGERRRVSVYWRGRYTKDTAAGALRARLW